MIPQGGGFGSNDNSRVGNQQPSSFVNNMDLTLNNVLYNNGDYHNNNNLSIAQPITDRLTHNLDLQRQYSAQKLDRKLQSQNIKSSQLRTGTAAKIHPLNMKPTAQFNNNYDNPYVGSSGSGNMQNNDYFSFNNRNDNTNLSQSKSALNNTSSIVVPSNQMYRYQNQTETTRDLTRVNLDKIGKDNLIKLAQLRKQYDQCQDVILDYQRKMAENQVKVDKSLETYNQINQQKEVYKQKLYEVKKENLKIVRKTENVTEEIKELDEAFKSGLEVAKRGVGGYGGYGLQRQNKFGTIDEATRQEREKMKKNLYVGVDYIGDEDIRLNADVKHKSNWDRFQEKLWMLIEKFGPLRGDIRYIEARYDKQILNFFVFFRFIFYLSLVTFATFLYLCIKHIELYISKSSNVRQLCDEFYPFYARALFNCWDWRISDSRGVLNQRIQVYNQIKLRQREDRIRIELGMRSEKEKWRLIIKRSITMIFSFIVLTIGWMIIIILSIYENDMQDYISKYNKFLGTWAPTALVTLVNFIVPKILGMITDFEEWEFASTQMKHEVWRTYLAGILNNLIFVVIYTEVFIDKPFLRDTFIADFYQSNSNGVIRFPCKEDMIAIQYIKLLISETVIRYLYYLYWIVHHKVVSYCKGVSWKKPFETADILWFNMIFSPFISLLSPILLYLHFRFIYLRLTKMKVQPEGASNDDKIGYFIMVFMNITFLCVVVFVGFLLFYPAPHSFNLVRTYEYCGAFSSESYWYEPIENFLIEGEAGDIIFTYFISNSILLLFFSIVFIVLTSVFWKNIKLLLSYIESKTKEVEYNIDDLQYKLRGLQQKDKYFRDNRKIE
eukprot:403356606